MFSPFCFAALVDVVTQMARVDVLSDFLCASNLFLLSEAAGGFWNKSKKWSISDG